MAAASVAAVLTAAVLAACGTSDDAASAPSLTLGPATTSAAPPPSSTQASTPTPTASGFALADRSDPKLGITFEKIPTGTTGWQAAAIDTAMRFEVENWRSLVDGKLSSGLSDVTTKDTRKQVKDLVDGNRKRGSSVRGNEVDTYLSVDGSSKVAIVQMCNSWEDAYFVRDGKKVAGPDRAVIKLEVSPSVDGVWRLQGYSVGDPC
ncbi:hypothetical protein [Cellulomonas sp. HZM]|uniref:hypothetical protein n=1 Tax=Cellulomonas sp. HZM TaxID=1454010 RepID=UPI000493AA99|nr:hypothetical protein [Cellulomonas sp. HZM]